MIRTCLCLVRWQTARGPEVLLGLKKTGFGAGKWVGLGGHIEEGEKPEAAAVREVQEESSLVVPADSLQHMASITFLFPARPSWIRPRRYS
jgi:8-oxo-dGTP diphosphatase